MATLGSRLPTPRGARGVRTMARMPAPSPGVPNACLGRSPSPTTSLAARISAATPGRSASALVKAINTKATASKRAPAEVRKIAVASPTHNGVAAAVVPTTAVTAPRTGASAPAEGIAAAHRLAPPIAGPGRPGVLAAPISGIAVTYLRTTPMVVTRVKLYLGRPTTGAITAVKYRAP